MDTPRAVCLAGYLRDLHADPADLQRVLVVGDRAAIQAVKTGARCPARSVRHDSTTPGSSRDRVSLQASPGQMPGTAQGVAALTRRHATSGRVRRSAG
jgi:hypothetical protein